MYYDEGRGWGGGGAIETFVLTRPLYGKYRWIVTVLTPVGRWDELRFPAARLQNRGVTTAPAQQLVEVLKAKVSTPR